ncbi:MAG: hypothetical protein HY658_11495 [Actinobacteria bacterium]|nr:hypothetical protein [Actinomycetota bacterium]
MDEHWLDEAREAARVLRDRSGASLPLPGVFPLDPATARLLGALTALGILAPGEVPGVHVAEPSPAMA